MLFARGMRGEGERTFHQVLVCGDLLRRAARLDDLEECEKDALSVVDDVGLTEATRARKVSVGGRKRKKERDEQESAVLLDEEDTLDGDGGVGVNDKAGVLEVGNEEGKDREKLLLREL